VPLDTSPSYNESDPFLGVAEELRKGNPEAFTRLYEKYHTINVFFAWRFTGIKQDAEDIVAQSFTKLWQKRETMLSEGQIKAFLQVVTKNACLDYLRSRKTKTAKQEELYTVLLENKEEEGFAEHQYNALLFARIHQEIEKLPEQCRKIFKLAYLEEMKNREIAALLGISASTVKNQKLRAIQLLKAALGPSFFIFFKFL
jgi:RNA polymerase sigma-70 factor (ECF subfamily)